MWYKSNLFVALFDDDSNVVEYRRYEPGAGLFRVGGLYFLHYIFIFGVKEKANNTSNTSEIKHFFPPIKYVTIKGHKNADVATKTSNVLLIVQI